MLSAGWQPTIITRSGRTPIVFAIPEDPVTLGSDSTHFVLVTAGMLVVFFLDHPYANENSSIVPTEMRRTLTVIDHGGAPPCDERGIPRS